MQDQIREQLIAMFNCGVEAVEGFAATQRTLQQTPYAPDFVLAVGKAASGMCAGALSALAAQGCHPKALLVTKYDHTDAEMTAHSDVTVIESAHPVPDQNSLHAGAQMLQAVQAMPAGSKLLLLVSGGTSSLAEALPAEVSLEQWQQLTQQMLSAGFDIAQINARRKETSLIKDGKLLQHFGGAQVRVMAISDVEGDSISVIGSGTGDTARTQAKASIELIGTNSVARQAVLAKAEALGFSVQCNLENLYCDVNEAVQRVAEQLDQAAPGVYIFGGEPTVELPPNPGSGGRNQALALGLAVALAGRDHINILVAGTDGSDGPTDAAGGIVDTSTAVDSAAAEDALRRADAGSFLRACGDIFITGPTNTNVMDLTIAIVE
ncbi:MAG: DUF4147 domain-containing protein [Pseudomonadales bacterium]